MPERSFDFAYIPAGPASETVALAELGEALGYRSFWLPDQGFHRDPFVHLALCAAATRRIKLGTGITSPFTRLPAQIARAAGAIDEIASGRFLLGLGTANVANVVKPLGMPYQHPVGRLRDSILLIRRLLAGEKVDFEGEHDQLKGVHLEFTTRADIPIYVGTRGSQTMEMAGAYADGVLVESLFAGAGLPHVLEQVGKGASRAGRPLVDVDIVSWQLVFIADDPRAAIAAHKPWIARAFQVGPPEALRMIGIDEEERSRVAALIEDGDRQSAISQISDDSVRCLMVIGNATQVAEQIQGIFDRGANAVALLHVGSFRDTAANLARFAADVMPAMA